MMPLRVATSDAPIHVLHLTPRLTRAAGGAWHYVSGLTGGLEQVGVRCAVGGVVDIGSTDPATLAASQILTGDPSFLPANYGFSRQLARRIGDEIGHVDLVHAHGFRVGTDLLALRVAKRFGVPLVLSPHGQLHPSIAERGALRKKVIHALWGRRILGSIHLAMGVSEVETDVIRQAIPDDKPVGWLPIGIEPSQYRVGKTSYLRQHAPNSVGKRILLYFAYIHPNKGLARLADAWLKLFQARPDWHLVIGGVDVSGLGAATAKRLREAGAGDSFSLIGPAFERDKCDLFADADLFTMPSDSESFGIAFAESLASGVPVIATRGAPWQSIVERRCGWWIDPTVDALTDALKDATSFDPQALGEMGLRGRTFVLKEFDWLSIATRMRSAYEWLLHRSPCPSFVQVPDEQ